MSGVEDRIQAIEDREAIRELTARYCHGIASADVAGIVALFTDDGRFVIDGNAYQGTDALTAFYSNILSSPPMPFIQNHVVDEQSPTQARARCSAEIRMIRDGESITAAGWYADAFRRVDGEWKFAERDFTTFHMVPLSEGWAAA